MQMGKPCVYHAGKKHPFLAWNPVSFVINLFASPARLIENKVTHMGMYARAAKVNLRDGNIYIFFREEDE